MEGLDVQVSAPPLTTGTVAGAERPWAGVVLFTLAAQFMTVLMIGASIAPGYDVTGGAISDLGVTPETRLMFNASLLAVGALNVAGGLLVFHGRPRVLAAFLVAGAGAMGAGLFPLDTVTPHALSAFAAFVGFNVEAIVSGTTLRGPMRAISVLLGVIGLVFVVLMAIGDSGTGAAFGPIGHRATEQLIVYPPMLWLLAFGGYLMRERDGTAS